MSDVKLSFQPARHFDAPYNLLDIRRLEALGWRRVTTLEQGLPATIEWVRGPGRSMEKVLFIITTLRRCEPVNILFDIVKYLDRDRLSAHVLTLSPEDGDSRWDDFVAADDTVSCLDVEKGIGYDMDALRLKGIVASIVPDVVH